MNQKPRLLTGDIQVGSIHCYLRIWSFEQVNYFDLGLLLNIFLVQICLG